MIRPAFNGQRSSSMILRRAFMSLVAAAGLLAAVVVPALAAPAFPFGSHRQPYVAGVLTPSRSPAALDRATASFYDAWKAAYLRPACKPGQTYVKADTFSGATVVSEGQGYGMLIVAMMAGHDPDAKRLFDEMLAYALDHPSEVDGALMAWAQNASCQNIFGNNSATDGDMDIAYALLLAHKQWGSSGPVDYRAAARKVIAGLWRSNVDPDTRLTTLGDWVTVGSGKYDHTSRSSDWMPGHFRAFQGAGAGSWSATLNRTMTLIDTLQKTYAPDTGLLPDFVVRTDGTARPAPAGWLEGPADGRYNYNACRDPWRLGIDAAISGDARSTRAARKISRWAKTATEGKPNRLRDGYKLNGGATVQYNTMSFVAPFAVAATVDPQGQAWLDALWDMIVAAPADGYYPDSIKLLSMLAVSRNWLTP